MAGQGAAHDRAVRRKVAVVAPILIIVAAVISYVLLGRHRRPHVIWRACVFIQD